MDEATRASLAVLLLALLAAPMVAPAALAQQPRLPRSTQPASVKAYVLELPRGLPSRYAVVALLGGRPVPVLAIPYPLKPFRAAEVKEVLVDGKPLGQLLKEDPEKARRLLVEEKDVKIVTVPVKGLAWSPGSRELLVIVPAGATVGGEPLAREQLEALQENTLAAYRAGSLEIRIAEPTKTVAAIAAPPFTPPIMNDTVFGYSMTMGAARLDIDVTPASIERLARTATLLKPVQQRIPIPSPLQAGEALYSTLNPTSTASNTWWETPYTMQFLSQNGAPKPIQAIDLAAPPTMNSIYYMRCWSYKPLAATNIVTASATLKPFAPARVELTVSIYLGDNLALPLARKSYKGFLKPTQAVTLLAEWSLPFNLWSNPPKLTACVKVYMTWAGGQQDKRHAGLYVTVGGYKLATTRSVVQPSPSDNTYTVNHNYALERPGSVAEITRATTIPVAITPNAAPGPIYFKTYLEEGSAAFFLGNMYLGSAQQWYWKTADAGDALSLLAPYILTGKAVPLTIVPDIGPGDKVKLNVGFTSLSYVAYALGLGEEDNKPVYKPASNSDIILAAEPLVLQILLADNGTLLEAGEVTATTIVSRPLKSTIYSNTFIIDVAASMKPYSYGVDKIYLSATETEDSAFIAGIPSASYSQTSGTNEFNENYQEVLWVLGAAGLFIGGGVAVGLVPEAAASAAEILSYALSPAATALGEPHVFSMLSAKTLPLKVDVKDDTIRVEGDADSGSFFPWSSWRSVLYRALYTVDMRGSSSPVQLSLDVAVYLKLDWRSLWMDVPCYGWGSFEYSSSSRW